MKKIRLSHRQSLLAITLWIGSLLPAGVFAALGDNQIVENNTDTSLSTFLHRIQNWLLGMVGGLAVLFLIYGGFLYITSGGNKERIETAKKTITYAIFGLIVVILAGTILEVITGGFMTSIFGSKNL